MKKIFSQSNLIGFAVAVVAGAVAIAIVFRLPPKFKSKITG